MTTMIKQWNLYKAHPLEIRLSASNSKVAKIHKSQGNSKLLSSVISRQADESTKTAKSIQRPDFAVVHLGHFKLLDVIFLTFRQQKFGG